MADLLYKVDVYNIVAVCLEVYRTLGFGFSEVVYKDAIEIEFKARNIHYLRENAIVVLYKDTPLNRRFRIDFSVFDKIIVEVKVNKDGITDAAVAQTLNYLKASGMKLGLVVNFGGTSLNYKRLIY
ncbi:GxxExxY protein [Lacibacter cauensis]|uniref:GxxExxY protein n=1 Tax=Lacibacter cauensis TaxID=510947 RepID=A0A562SPY0_9BACT|nr:GxxExxY protein [Lacibacter cauensis]TWI83292.1 GxxExxY protein [Lacibacter cauensis]